MALTSAVHYTPTLLAEALMEHGVECSLNANPGMIAVLEVGSYTDNEGNIFPYAEWTEIHATLHDVRDFLGY